MDKHFKLNYEFCEFFEMIMEIHSISTTFVSRRLSRSHTNLVLIDETNDNEEDGFLRSHLNYGKNELKINL